MPGGSGKNGPNVLVVEDNDLFDTVTSLARARVAGWPHDFNKDGAPVFIRNLHSAKEALQADFLDPLFKTSTLKALGVLVDAESNFQSRWDSVRGFATRHFKAVPKHCPPEGLVLEEGGRRFGSWIMPNNQSSGMLEDMCFGMVPAKFDALWKHAGTIATDALKSGALYKPVHARKAHLRTYLALQNPPGEGIGEAIAKNFFDANAGCCDKFVAWLEKLYQL